MISSLLGLPRAAELQSNQREIAMGLLRRFGLERYADRRPDDLGYEVQKLKTRLAQRIMGLRQTGIAVVWIEHDVEVVWECEPSGVHVLDVGVCIASGPPDRVKADPAVAAAYFGQRRLGRFPGEAQPR